MLAIAEKPRTVVVLSPQILLNGKEGEIIAAFQDEYLEVKARKEVCFTTEDAEMFFSYLSEEGRAPLVEAFTRGLCLVLVLEHLEGEALAKTCDLAMQFGPKYGEGSVYWSQTQWEAERDLEHFFPSMQYLPVERTLVVLKPDALAAGQVGGKTIEDDVTEQLIAADLFVVARREMHVDATAAKVLCMEMDTEDFDNAVSLMLQDPGVVAIVVEGPGAVPKLMMMTGPLNSGRARDRAPTSIRARWGTDSTSNAIHCSHTIKDAEAEIALMFPKGTMHLQKSVLLVKPDAMPDLFEIRAALTDRGFTVIKEKQTQLTEKRAEHFCSLCAEAYKDQQGKLAVPGLCHILVVCRLEAVDALKQLVGPSSVEEAKAHPKSLRAKFGPDAVHCSASHKVAGREISFFFPEMGIDPAPGDAEVRDYVFRKSAGASMELKVLSETDNVNPEVDETLQQLLSKGLLSLCQVQPKGLDAVKWLSKWLFANNPNTAQKEVPPVFNPPDRVKKFVEHGVNQDGMAFVVEAPPQAKQKEVVDVDVSQEAEDAAADAQAPPLEAADSCSLVYLVGPPGAPMAAVGKRLEEQYGYSAINLMKLLQEFVESDDPEAPKVKQALAKGRLVDASVVCPLILKAMYRDMALGVQKFVVCDFPQSLKEVRFLEHRVPCTQRTMLLDFSKPDAEDLSALAPPMKYLNADAAVENLFSVETKEMLKEMRARRVKCNLAELNAPGSVQEQLAEMAWAGVQKKLEEWDTVEEEFEEKPPAPPPDEEGEEGEGEEGDEEGE
mmetsp:Transcript_20712/g.47559  ORF Transcript_20712/g.47559 Transcript_20712/m.47559 type:complete len:778 (+) Transcript_20712:117-2450(+)